MSAFKRDGRRCDEWGGREGWLATIEFLTDTASPVRLDVNKANNEQIESTAFVPTEEESISTTPHEDPRSDSASSLDHTDYHSTSLEAATSPLDTDDSPQSRPSDTPENSTITTAQDQFNGSVSESNEDEAPKFILATDEVRPVENEKRAFVSTS